MYLRFCETKAHRKWIHKTCKQLYIGIVVVVFPPLPQNELKESERESKTSFGIVPMEFDGFIVGSFAHFFFLLCCQICVLAFFCPTQFARLLPVQETICFTFISFLFKSMWHVVFGWMVKCLTRWLYVANGVLPSEIHAIASHYFNWALCTCDRMSGVCRALIFNNCDRRKKIIVSVIRN